MKQFRKQAALALALLTLMTATLTSCTLLPWEQKEEPEELEELEPEDPRGELRFINTLELPTGPQWDVELPGMTRLAADKYRQNDDTIGWLRLPNTSIDDVVMFYPDDANDYYLRRDFEKRPNDYGTYFVDFRCAFDEAYRWQSFSTNTTIYGHSMSDNPDGQAFSQLKKYLDEDFARENPNIYFSTLGEDTVWEVFAVYYATTSLPYNTPEWSDFDATLQECLDRSIYNYDVSVTKDDKILTLSTCCYNYVPTYPNNYRYVIMAKLLHAGEPVKETAVLARNPSPKGP